MTSSPKAVNVSVSQLLTHSAIQPFGPSVSQAQSFGPSGRAHNLYGAEGIDGIQRDLEALVLSAERGGRRPERRRDLRALQEWS